MTTSILKERLQDIRKALLRDLFIEVQSTKNMKIKFTETQAPHFYYDGDWRDIIQLSVGGVFDHSVMFGWHDKRCSSKGANAFVPSAQISTDMLLQFHELVCSK